MCQSNNPTAQKALVAVALLVYILSLIIAYLNQARVAGLYLSSNGLVDSKYCQEISPAPRAFAVIWPIIYLWNAVAVFYIGASVFLAERKSPVNVKPTLISIPFLCCHILAFASTIGWLFAFDREILGLSLFILILATAAIYAAIVILCKRVYDNLTQLETKEHKVMLLLVRLFILNGLGLPATWLTIATCLNLTDVIIYQDSAGFATAQLRGIISVENGSTAILAVLFVIIIVWFVLDNFIFEKYTRYLFTTFPVLILGLSALVAKLRSTVNSYCDPLAGNSNRNLTFASVILGFTVVALIVRIALVIYRVKNKAGQVSTETKSPMVEEKV